MKSRGKRRFRRHICSRRKFYRRWCGEPRRTARRKQNEVGGAIDGHQHRSGNLCHRRGSSGVMTLNSAAETKKFAIATLEDGKPAKSLRRIAVGEREPWLRKNEKSTPAAFSTAQNSGTSTHSESLGQAGQCKQSRDDQGAIHVRVATERDERGRRRECDGTVSPLTFTSANFRIECGDGNAEQ